MPREFNRSERVAELVRRGMAGLLATEINDPRVKMVTITDVELSRDMRHANIFVTSVETRTAAQQEAMMSALDKASGFLRHHLAENMDLRRCPQLHFQYDHSVQKGADLTLGGAAFANIRVDYVEVPLILRVGIPILPAISPYIYGGPAIAFKVSCKAGPEGGTSTDCDDPAGLDTEVSSTTYSGILGLGVQLSRFLIAIQYDLGFDSVIDDPVVEVKNETWTLKAGFGI